MKITAAAAALLGLMVLAGCAATPGATPTVTVTATVTATATATVTATPSPLADAAPADDRLAALREVSAQVTGVEDLEPGYWVVHTSIEDPKGEGDDSPETQRAIAICERAVELGATRVSVMESNGSSFVLYGHPSYGDVCAVA